MGISLVVSGRLRSTYPEFAAVQFSAEASLIGGLADWFAVVALCRHPLGLPLPAAPGDSARLRAGLKRRHVDLADMPPLRVMSATRFFEPSSRLLPPELIVFLRAARLRGRVLVGATESASKDMMNRTRCRATLSRHVLSMKVSSASIHAR